MSSPFDAIDVIRAKRDGQQLTPEQIRWVIGAYTGGDYEQTVDEDGDPAQIFETQRG